MESQSMDTYACIERGVFIFVIYNLYLYSSDFYNARFLFYKKPVYKKLTTRIFKYYYKLQFISNFFLPKPLQCNVFFFKYKETCKETSGTKKCISSTKNKKL